VKWRQCLVPDQRTPRPSPLQSVLVACTFPVHAPILTVAPSMRESTVRSDQRGVPACAVACVAAAHATSAAAAAAAAAAGVRGPRRLRRQLIR
jgi:hypothetical protein